MSAAAKKKRYTPEEYLALEREAEFRSEYVNGEIIRMSGGTTWHSRICSCVNRFIDEKLDGTPCFTLESNTKVKIVPANSYRYPDVIVVCGEMIHEDESNRVLLNPTVLVEVLSRSTEDSDLSTKFFQYQQIPTLKELIHVAQNQPLILHHVRQGDDSWSTKFVSGLDATLDFVSIPVSLPLSQVYDRIQFPEQP